MGLITISATLPMGTGPVTISATLPMNTLQLTCCRDYVKPNESKEAGRSTGHHTGELIREKASNSETIRLNVRTVDVG